MTLCVILPYLFLADVADFHAYMPMKMVRRSQRLRLIYYFLLAVYHFRHFFFFIDASPDAVYLPYFAAITPPFSYAAAH